MTDTITIDVAQIMTWAVVLAVLYYVAIPIMRAYGKHLKRKKETTGKSVFARIGGRL